MAYTSGTQLKYEVLFYSTIAAGGTYYWINKGFSALEGGFNPTTRDVQYIGESNKTTETTALAQKYTFTVERFGGDEINDDMYLIQKEKLQDILNHTRTLIRVDTHDPHAISGWYTALKADYKVNIENFDTGAPGEITGGTGSYSREGTVSEGWFNPTTKAWSDDEPTV